MYVQQLLLNTMSVHIFASVTNHAKCILTSVPAGMWQCSLLRNCSTRRKVIQSVLHSVNGFFFFLCNPSCCNMALGSTQPLTEMSSMRLTTSPPVIGLQREGLPALLQFHPLKTSMY
jgi:hypothetical protein